MAGVAFGLAGRGDYRCGKGVTRRRDVVAIVGITASAGMAGVALGLAGRGDYRCGKGMTRGRGVVAVVGIAASAGMAGVALGLAGRRNHRIGVRMSHGGKGSLHGRAANDAVPHGLPLSRAGGGRNGLPRGGGVGMRGCFFGWRDGRGGIFTAAQQSARQKSQQDWKDVLESHRISKGISMCILYHFFA